jgi:hypothetical protein
MTKMTKQDIIDYFKGNNNLHPDDQDWGYNNNAAEAAMYDDWQQPDGWENVTSKSMDHYGGEDCGSTYYTIWKFTVDGTDTFYLRFDGWYASHYGTDYQDFREVQPHTVTKVEYF